MFPSIKMLKLIEDMKLIKVVLVYLVLIVHTVQACGPGRGIGGPRRSRKLTPLVFKQHVPNVSENTLGASGLVEGKISREDAKFEELVPNYSKDIIFKDEEGTGADRLMTQRCKEKLNTLAVSVMNQWPGVRLRVTEGWDEEDFHAPESLHYEGRAVDITTSDRDRSKYGMLARLAVEAGFDWVYYESRAHIHCSVKSDSSQASHASGCFTSESTVQTSRGETKKLDELEVGEKILSVDATGNTIYSEVIMFLDRDINRTREFVQIKTSGQAVIRVTPAHLLLVWQPRYQQTKYIYADQVEENDYLLVNKKSNLEPQRVVEVSAVLARGVIAPLTREGTVVVDSIAASCYALVNSQSLAHISFMPFRAINSISHFFGEEKPTRSKQNGIHWYAKTLYKIKDYVLPSNYMYGLND